jgi:hypothetical protein
MDKMQTGCPAFAVQRVKKKKGSKMNKWMMFILVAGLCGVSQAALTLTIDSLTTDQLTFSISGTFDTAPNETWLAVKNDWSNNQGYHTEMFSGAPTVSFNSLLINGVSASPNIASGSETWGDSIYFSGTMQAGTAVSGTITLTGAGMFIPANLGNLQLVSGFTRPVGHDDWARLESSSSIPEPATALILGLGGALIALYRRFFGQI